MCRNRVTGLGLVSHRLVGFVPLKYSFSQLVNFVEVDLRPLVGLEDKAKNNIKIKMFTSADYVYYHIITTCPIPVSSNFKTKLMIVVLISPL